MINKKYTYSDVYSAIRRVSSYFEYFDEKENSNNELFFREFILFLATVHFINKSINSEKQDELLKKVLKDTLSSTNIKDIIVLLLEAIHKKQDNYFNEIKYDIFSNATNTVNVKELHFNFEDLLYKVDVDENVSFSNIVNDIVKILSIKDIAEVIDIFSSIPTSNANKFYIPRSFITQILPSFISQDTMSQHNLYCMGLNPYSLYEAYKNSLNGKRVNVTTDIFIEQQSDSLNIINALLMNLLNKAPHFYFLPTSDWLNEDSVDILVLGVENDRKTKSVLGLYNKALKITTNKAYILVSATNLTNGYNTVLKEQHISKIISFPNKYFTHTIEPQALLEISKEPVKGICFIDLGLLPKPTAQLYRNELFNMKHLKQVANYNEENELYIQDLNNESILVAKYVRYDDIISKYNNNLNTNYYLTAVQEINDGVKLNKIGDVKKLQKYNALKGTIPLSIFSISEFSEFGFTTPSNIKKKIRFEAPLGLGDIKRFEVLEKENKLTDTQKTQYKRYKKFKDNHQLQEYDILIYVNDPSVIAIVKGISTYAIASHNLIRLRIKDSDIDTKEKTAKSLYLFLLSELGQKALQKMLVKSTSGRSTLPIEQLENIEVSVEDRSAKFDILEKEQRKLEKLKAKIMSEIQVF